MQNKSISFSDKASKLLDEYQSGFKNDDGNRNEFHDYLMNFYKLLGEYVSEETFIQLRKLRLECGSEQEVGEFDEDVDELQVYLAIGEYSGVSSSLSKKLEKISIIIEEISFPKDNSITYIGSESREMLWRLGRIEFINCKFESNHFRINNNTYFKDCNFKEIFSINPFLRNNFDDRYRYINCTFDDDVDVIPSSESKEILCNLFYECDFLKKLTIQNLNFKKAPFIFPDPLALFKSWNINEPTSSFTNKFDKIKNCHKFKKLTISDCNFDLDFKLNGFNDKYLKELKRYKCEYEADSLTIEELEIVDTKFESKVEIKNRVIENFEFNNSNVTKIFDSFKSKFVKAKFSKSIFNDFTGFEEVHFGLPNEDGNEDFITVFEHVTFMDFSSFRDAEFNSGLDFSKTNLKDEPNFLNVKVNSLNTKRETFRIIKNSFDAAGNKIEANKFFIEEMKAYRKELKKNGGNWLERLILFFNRWISNFGGNYVMPIGWLIASIVLYTAVIYWYNSFFIENEYFWHPHFDTLSIHANDFAKNFLPFSRFLTGRSGIEFVSLLFYIWFAVLTWQIIVAVKRHTQR